MSYFLKKKLYKLVILERLKKTRYCSSLFKCSCHHFCGSLSQEIVKASYRSRKLHLTVSQLTYAMRDARIYYVS